ncbi:MAG TPA: effector-associated domain EAD1-containing protein, partial [Pyrinomonadaceae bacterium]|nr:effector-associated domain EAD1-containing protein [Pyrinomonadaceae bacterium]
LLKDFDALLNAMGLSDEPFLLVLDTFEEVQYRSHQYIEQLLEALEELQSILPRLRTVFSGRALLKDFATEEVALNDLDAAAARGFLTASKIEPKTLIDTIVKRIGGNPLSLRLAVQIFHNEGGASREFFNRLQKERIQSALYTRVLEHIHDKNVMKLAHPGLILRRITPGLILKVLAKPCKVEVKDLVEAEKLFDSLSQEITLVVPGGTTKDEPRALRHMTEVRRGMIQLLREDEEQKDKVLEIQQNAIAYYEPFDDPVSRAEEIYHRLMLKDDHDVIAERWIAGVRDNLFNAIEELEPKEQGFLAARLDVDIEDDILAQANQADWEVIVSRRVNNFLSLGQPDRALQTLGMRNEYLPGSVLYVLQAQAYQGMGRLEEAAAVIDRGLASYPDSTWVTFRLTMMAGGVDLLMGRHQKAFQRLLDGRKLASEMNAPMQKVEATLGLLRPELSNLLEADTRASLEKELLELLKTIPDSTLSEQLGLVRYAVDRFGERDDDLVIRAVRLVGFESANQRQLRSLARAIAEWDLSLSSAANADPGLLARKARIPLLSEISETWKQFAQTFPPTVVKDVVSLLLSNYAMTPNVRSALIAILRTPSRDEVSSETQDPSDAAGSGNTRVGTGIPVTPITLRLTPDERQSVTYALMSAFPTRSSLERMLFYRLNINLNSISLTDNLNSTVDILVQYAETRGLMVHLIAVAR